MRFLLCLLSFVFFTLPAFAQDAAQTQRLLQFAANNDSFDKTITAQARDNFSRQFPGCAQVAQIVRQLPQALTDLTFPNGTQRNPYPAPSAGLWIEHVKVRACDRVRQINMLATGQTNGNVVLLALLPGDTHAVPAIQRQAERAAGAVISKADATCAQTPTASNTRFIGYRGLDGKLRSDDVGSGWFEEWDYRFCDRDVATQVAFIPGKNGVLDMKARLPEAEAPEIPLAKPAAAVASPTPAAATP